MDSRDSSRNPKTPGENVETGNITIMERQYTTSAVEGNVYIPSVSTSSPSPKRILKEAYPGLGMECSHERNVMFNLTSEQEAKSYANVTPMDYYKRHRKIKRQQRRVLARKMEDDSRDSGVVVNLLVKETRVGQGPEWDAVIPGTFAWKERKVTTKNRKTDEVVPKVNDDEICLWLKMCKMPSLITK